MRGRAIAFLGTEEMVEQPVGFMSSMEGSENPTAWLRTVGTLEGLPNGWAVPSGALPDEKEGIAEGGITALGQMANPGTVPALLVDRIEPSERPDLIRRRKAFNIPDRRQIPGRMIRTHARDTQ